MVSVPDVDANIITAVTGSGSSCCYAAAAAIADAAASAKQTRFGKLPLMDRGGVFSIVTVQYPHSYGQKSIENCLRQWDFCLQAHVFIRSAQ